MSEHSASVVVDAPVHQVYALWSHFNDYPKFMSFVKEVTYLDDERSHWVVDVGGSRAWDAVNEDWIEDRQIGWRSVGGIRTRGRVLFAPEGESRTRLTVRIGYEPPAGVAGAVADAAGIAGEVERRIRHDLEHFARMVAAAPPGALDPTSSAYLFHRESAAARGTTTRAQNESMGMTGDSTREILADDGSGLAEPTTSTSRVSED